MCKDYVFGDRKIGGNAQPITKNRRYTIHYFYGIM